jgi:hypothetical protein
MAHAPFGEQVAHAPFGEQVLSTFGSNNNKLIRHTPQALKKSRSEKYPFGRPLLGANMGQKKNFQYAQSNFGRGLLKKIKNACFLPKIDF